ncbi:DUF91 domain-containing protein [Halostella sp. JP-L12]|uniref:endonuclease NucS n=1 Tax=Halostella TaxID=1843185 RepID=UPI000EF76F46|nr:MULTISPECIES: endonuclease NucS [Halostella]NHN46174.1 DUF91 domain-containing protein [Halostella sp. JP-L12]
MRAYELLGGDTPTKRNVDPFRSEEKLEELLAEVPSLLLEEQLLIVGQQVGVETGTLDLLAVDKYGNIVVFELKRGESGTGSASEGSILSQPQQYAQALQWFSYDELNDVYQEYRTDCSSTDGAEGSVSRSESLLDAFITHFGTRLEPEGFNQHQRMVIVAEEITDRTATNARYLRDEGLHLQCVEVQRFRLTEGEETPPILVASTVVDYDEKQVQPNEDGTITFPDINEAIASKAFPTFEEITHATALNDLFPGGFDLREPRMRSLHPDHPDTVRYVLRVKPLECNHVRISIDVTTRGLDIDTVDKESLTDRLRSASDRFERAGFEVNHSRNTFRIVSKRWDIDSVADVRNDAFLEEVADRYAELVRIGHEVMLDTK